MNQEHEQPQHNQDSGHNNHNGSEKNEGHQPKASNDNSNDTAMGILSYLGILVIIPIIVAQDSEFAMYHANQGLILLIGAMILFAVGWIPVLGWIVGFFGWIVVMIFAIMGIINAANGKKKPLPLIGGFNLLN